MGTAWSTCVMTITGTVLLLKGGKVCMVMRIQSVLFGA